MSGKIFCPDCGDCYVQDDGSWEHSGFCLIDEEFDDWMERDIIVVELWAGDATGTRAWSDCDNVTVITVEINPKFNPTICRDIGQVTAQDILELTGWVNPDFVWASPDCSVFSVAGFAAGHFEIQDGVYVPKTVKAVEMCELHKHSLQLIQDLDPTYWVIENPVGLLRKMPWMQPLIRHTVTYCAYHDTRMKPTDLWGKFPLLWEPRPKCKNGDPCHEAAPRGSKTGTQGLDHRERSHIPFQLSQSLLVAAIGSKGHPKQRIQDWKAIL